MTRKNTTCRCRGLDMANDIATTFQIIWRDRLLLYSIAITIAIMTLATIVALFTPAQGHAASLPPDEATWRPLARECSVKIGEQGGLWPQWAECAVPKYYSGRTLPLRVQNYGPKGLAVVLQLCISEVKAQRAGPVTDRNCNNCGDPVRDVFACVSR